MGIDLNAPGLREAYFAGVQTAIVDGWANGVQDQGTEQTPRVILQRIQDQLRADQNDPISLAYDYGYLSTYEPSYENGKSDDTPGIDKLVLLC